MEINKIKKGGLCAVVYSSKYYAVNTQIQCSVCPVTGFYFASDFSCEEEMMK